MSQPSDELLHELGKSSAAVEYLDRYLQALLPEEEAKMYALAQAALFDDEKLNAARVQFGRLEMLRDLHRRIQNSKQYTR